MVQFSNCKINLGLHIVRKRSDGFHDLETIFYPLPFYDIIEIITAPEFAFTSTGLHIPGTEIDNLCVKAYWLLQKDFPEIPPIHLHLHKNIPMGAGLGGGSANAAYTVQLLNKKFRLQLTKPTLKKYAAILGSDCSFFIENQPCFASGRGEILEPLACDLSAYTIVLLFPGISISTADAFAKIQPAMTSVSLQEIITTPVDNWKYTLKNDFENSVFPQYPELKLLLEKLYDVGATYASMTGSGSTLFGIFPKNTMDAKKMGVHFPQLASKVL